MKHIWKMFGLIVAGCLWAGAAQADDAITLTINATNYAGVNVPADFLGLSYEKNTLTVTGTPYFSPTRGDIITSFQNMGLRNLRIGGGSADGTNGAHPSDAQITGLFQFAQAAGVYVIYGLQLLDCNVASNCMEATYILTNSFAPWLDYIAIGNEPFFYTNTSVWPGGNQDPRITSYNGYLFMWETNVYTIESSNPGTTFAAPDEDIWGTNFVKDVDNPSEIKLNTAHFYPTDVPNGAAQHIQDMLSPYWVGILYSNQYTWYTKPWVAKGYPYRYTEMNDDPYLTNSTDGFASALWALDALNWWASNGCAGINFHNQFGKLADTIWNINPGNEIMPKGYAIKAFDMGGHGYSEPTSPQNSTRSNVDCYATAGGQDVYVTVVNKQYSGNGGGGGLTADVTINLKGMFDGTVRAMYLTQTSGNVEATNGVTLGNASLTNNAQFVPGWQDLSPLTNSQCTVDVPIAEGAVIHIRAACAYSPPIQVNNNGTLEMFAVTNNGDICHRWQNANDALNPAGSNPANWIPNYSDLGPLDSGVTVAGGPVVVRNPDGTLEVLVPGSDGNVYDNYQVKPSGSWVGWYSLGGQGITNLQVNVNSDGSLNVFGIGSDGDVWNDTGTAPHILGTNWTDWTGQQIEPGFVVGQNLDGRLEVFGVDSSGTVYHRWQSGVGSTNWSGWNTLSGVTVEPQLQWMRNVDGREEVFGVDATSGSLDYISQVAAGQSWNSWNTTSLSGLPVQPGFVVGQNSNGRFEIFGVSSTNSNVFHNWITGTGGWNGWVNLGATNTDPQLTVANTEDGRLQLFVIGQNKDIWSNWQLTPSGSWNGWDDFGGNGNFFYPGQQ